MRQALAEALEHNTSVINIDLRVNELIMGVAGAEAAGCWDMSLGRRVELQRSAAQRLRGKSKSVWRQTDKLLRRLDSKRYEYEV